MYNDLVEALNRLNEMLQMPWWLDVLALLFVASSPLVITRLRKVVFSESRLRKGIYSENKK
jgi:hypothetical protein